MQENSIKAYEIRQNAAEKCGYVAVITPFAESQNQIAGYYDHLVNNHHDAQILGRKRAGILRYREFTKTWSGTEISTAEQINAALFDLVNI